MHGTAALATTAVCGGILCGDGAPAYVEIAQNAGFDHMSQCCHSTFQWTRFDSVKLQAPLRAEGAWSRPQIGSTYRFTAGSQLQESLWRPIKDSIRTRARGGNAEVLLSYFHLYVWRRCEQQTEKDRFAALGALLRRAREVGSSHF